MDRAMSGEDRCRGKREEKSGDKLEERTFGNMGTDARCTKA